MSADEIRAIVEVAISDSMGFPWLAYTIAVALAVLAVFLAAYLKRKGEKRADHEEFEQIREQLKRTTKDSEEIKVALAGKSWLSQQQWAIRERHYVDLLSHLTILRQSLSDRKAYFVYPGSEHDSGIDDLEQFKDLRARGDAAYAQLRILVGPAAIFLSDDVVRLLERLERDYWDVAEQAICTAEYTTQARQLVEEAQLAVLTAAKRELGGAAAPPSR